MLHVQVIRGGRRIQVSIFDIVVGDVVALKIGDQVSKQVYFSLVYV
jgi:P-type Ca2+ transporter type 2C